VLADVYYPGWRLTIDGVTAPIYRINRIMRGAAVDHGPHHLVFTYAPASFKWGLIISAVGIGSLALLGLGCFLRPVAQSLVSGPEAFTHDDDRDVHPGNLHQPGESRPMPGADPEATEGRSSA
jgi:hypothetical protein